MRKSLDNIELVLLCLIAVLMTVFIKLTPILIILSFVVALLKRDNYKYFSKLLKDYKYYIFISPLLLSLFGLINTENLSGAKHYIEVLLALPVFPFIATSLHHNKLNIKTTTIFSSFTIGIIISYLLCWLHAIPEFISSNDFNSFFYSNFSPIIGAHHLSYFVLFAIMLLSFDQINKMPVITHVNKTIKFTILILSILFLFQLSSKITILLFICFFVFFFIYMRRTNRISKKLFTTLSCGITIVIISVLSISNINIRFTEMLNDLTNKNNKNEISTSSTAKRLDAIEVSCSIIKDNFWSGTGTGDINAEMKKRYLLIGEIEAAKSYQSPHNQFLGSFAMYGILGLISLLLIFVSFFINTYNKKPTLFFAWGIMMLCLFFIEDIFNLQTCVTYFTYFYSLFIFGINYNKNIKTTTNDKTDRQS